MNKITQVRQTKAIRLGNFLFRLCLSVFIWLKWYCVFVLLFFSLIHVIQQNDFKYGTKITMQLVCPVKMVNILQWYCQVVLQKR